MNPTFNESVDDQLYTKIVLTFSINSTNMQGLRGMMTDCKVKAMKIVNDEEEHYIAVQHER